MSRHGKIGRLPRWIREHINRHLQNGVEGGCLLAELNQHPEVLAVLEAEFAGAAITKQNLSEWRKGGFVEWELKGDFLRDATETRGDAEEVAGAADGRLADHLATMLAARYSSLLRGWRGEVTEEFEARVKMLRGLTQDVAQLRRWDHSAAKVVMQREVHEAQREKSAEEVFKHFEAWVKKPEVHDWICRSWKTPVQREQEKRRLLGRKPMTEEEIAAMEGCAENSADQPPNSKEAPSAKDEGENQPAAGLDRPHPGPLPGERGNDPQAHGEASGGASPEVVSDQSKPVAPGQTSLTGTKVPGGESVTVAEAASAEGLAAESGEAVEGAESKPVQVSPSDLPATPVPGPATPNGAERVKGTNEDGNIPGQPEVPGGLLWGRGLPPEARPYRPTMCKGRCEVANGFCEGCQRTVQEILRWPSLPPENRGMKMGVVMERLRWGH